MKISTQFDAGSVTVIDINDPANIRLQLRPDNASEFKQWFYFRLQGAAYQNCVMNFENADDEDYADGCEDYQEMAFNDRMSSYVFCR